jgi:hypothetical protein
MGVCEVVAIFEVFSIFNRKASKRKPLSINAWKFHLRQIIRMEEGVKCEVVFGRDAEICDAPSGNRGGCCCPALSVFLLQWLLRIVPAE